MIIRAYQSDDLEDIKRLFYDTVHEVNAKDYSQEQLDAWAPADMSFEGWDESLLSHESAVAVLDGELVGFGDMDADGYLDRLYIHKDYQHRGIATAICEKLEKMVPSAIYCTHASITARPFFESRGYHVIKENRVCRRDVWMTNYTMEKKATQAAVKEEKDD